MVSVGFQSSAYVLSDIRDPYFARSQLNSQGSLYGSSGSRSSSIECSDLELSSPNSLGAASTKTMTKCLRQPWDMNSLKTAIYAAEPGSGGVGDAIRSCTFRPREQAFTRLICVCGRWKDAQKAQEVFDAMIESGRVKPNTILFTALISACSTSGDWQAAIRAFQRMEIAAVEDPGCLPNEITFEKIITVCENGGYYDSIVKYYKEMEARGIPADKSLYCKVLSACLFAGMWDEAESIFARMHDKGLAATPANYCVMIDYYAQKGQCESALELFLTMQKLDQEVDSECCHAMMRAFEVAKEPDMAMQLLYAMWQEEIHVQMGTYISALRTFAPSGKWGEALKILKRMVLTFDYVPDEAKTLILVAAKSSARNIVVTKLEALFNDIQEEDKVRPRTHN